MTGFARIEFNENAFDYFYKSYVYWQMVTFDFSNMNSFYAKNTKNEILAENEASLSYVFLYCCEADVYVFR
jgi:hypothetical protein